MLQDKSGDAARANFILARAAILDRDVPTAQKDFAETIRLSKDPRMLAWSHIYLGRLYDVQDDRDHAMTEYQAALVVRDGQPDTKQAAEEGLKRPYAVPQRRPRQARMVIPMRRTMRRLLHRRPVGSLARRGGLAEVICRYPGQSLEWASAFESVRGQKSGKRMAQQTLNTLQAALGHTFRHEKLLVRALTHSSLAYEEALESCQGESAAANASRDEDNEQLEFLGDAVLGLLVAEILFRRFPDFHEGEWTRLRASLVSRRHMAQVASAIGLGAYLRLGRGEERSDGRSKPALLANCMEAVIAALYLDGGLAPAESFVSQHVVSPYLSDLRKAMDSGISARRPQVRLAGAFAGPEDRASVVCA